MAVPQGALHYIGQVSFLKTYRAYVTLKAQHAVVLANLACNVR